MEFAGGIFVAASVTQSPPQNVLYVFGSNSSDIPEAAAIRCTSTTTPTEHGRVRRRHAVSHRLAPITGIHVRGEAGNDTFQADPDVTLPLWLYGGDGNNTLTGGAGNNVIVGGSGQNIDP